MTASERILARLESSLFPLAVHELALTGISENAAATRLSELARAGRVVGRFRRGRAFKEWAIDTIARAGEPS